MAFGFVACFFFAGVLIGGAGVLEWIAVRFVRWMLARRARNLRESTLK